MTKGFCRTCGKLAFLTGDGQCGCLTECSHGNTYKVQFEGALLSWEDGSDCFVVETCADCKAIHICILRHVGEGRRRPEHQWWREGGRLS